MTLRWQQAEGKRHALDINSGHPQPGVEFRALCGAEVTPKRGDCHRARREVVGPHLLGLRPGVAGDRALPEVGGAMSVWINDKGEVRDIDASGWPIEDEDD
ncbi:zinc finger protein [Amycolatopsis palatopharyngis]|uniref:zinc finger protein n=1 Tax=Amycolatopsis palatopharyngis TaxID=187982 RepID=UPI00319EA0AA